MTWCTAVHRGASSAWLCAVLWIGPIGLACVAGPTTAELLAVGFRTPAQTFQTFQTAIRADDANLEYRCFSSGFVSRNRLSRLNYREFRDELRKAQPFLRKGIADAEVVSCTPLPGGRSNEPVRMLLRSHGHAFQVDLVRDDFLELWADDRAVVDELGTFGAHTGLQQDGQGARWFYGQVPLPPGQDVSEVSELRMGREWKIDGLSTVDSSTVAPGVGGKDRLE